PQDLCQLFSMSLLCGCPNLPSKSHNSTRRMCSPQTSAFRLTTIDGSLPHLGEEPSLFVLRFCIHTHDRKDTTHDPIQTNHIHLRQEERVESTHSTHAARVPTLQCAKQRTRTVF